MNTRCINVLLFLFSKTKWVKFIRGTDDFSVKVGAFFEVVPRWWINKVNTDINFFQNFTFLGYNGSHTSEALMIFLLMFLFFHPGGFYHQRQWWSIIKDNRNIILLSYKTQGFSLTHQRHWCFPHWWLCFPLVVWKSIAQTASQRLLFWCWKRCKRYGDIP